MTKVFVPNDGGHDYSNAERYGEIVICTRGSLDRCDTSMMFRELEDALMDAEAGDYLLISSLTSICCIAAAMMGYRFGQVHFLLFQNGRYVVRDIMLENG